MTAGELTLRLFFAALPDSTGRERASLAAKALQLQHRNYVAPANYHVTLAFVGEVPASDLPIILSVGDAQRAENFSLCFDAYEYWPKPEVLVAAARAIPTALSQLWSELHVSLARHQCALDPKRLRPHVTLVRKVPQAPVIQAISAFEWPVTQFSLLRSDTTHGSTAYTVVHTWALLDEKP